jgi:Protein of unknown function (DUF1186)
MDVTGDLVTEDLGRILASVCDGNIEPIQQLIENRQANEYVRSSALNSLVILVVLETIEKWLLSILRNFFQHGSNENIPLFGLI